MRAHAYTHACTCTRTQINVKTKIKIVRAMLNVGEHQHVWSCQESVPPQTPTSRGAQALLLKAASREHEGTAPSSRGLKPTASIFPMKVFFLASSSQFLAFLGCVTVVLSVTPSSRGFFFLVCLGFQEGGGARIPTQSLMGTKPTFDPWVR